MFSSREKLRLAGLQRILRSSQLAQILVCTILGAATGTVVEMLRELVDWLHEMNFRVPPGHSLSEGLGLDPLRILLVPSVVGLLLGLAMLAANRYRASEIVDPVEANALYGGRMSMAGSIRLMVAALISNGAGASLGMEAAYTQVGASVFSSIGQALRLRRTDLRIFVTAGASSAIAAAFNAPLTGAFYGYELILGSYVPGALAPVAVAALMATWAERLLSRTPPLPIVSEAFRLDMWAYAAFALLGVAAAGFSILAMKSVSWAERTIRHFPLPDWLRPAVGGALLTIIAIGFPQTLGGGHGAIQYHIDYHWPLLALILMLIAKLAASAISIAAGFRGGMFSASLFLGCLFGLAIGQAAAMLFPPFAHQELAFMLVGMATMAAGIVGAPIAMVFLILETTGNFSITLAALAGVVIASTIVRLSFGYSFSTWRFHGRGMAIHGGHDVGWIADLTVHRLMRNDPKIVRDDILLSVLRQQFPIGSTKRVFVVDDKGCYVGMLDMAVVHALSSEDDNVQKLSALIAVSSRIYLLPNENIRLALTRFDDAQVEALPVLSSPIDRHVLGYLTESYALKRYAEELERRRNAELGVPGLYTAGG